MASINPLIENITCSICFEIYRDPHALACLHTYCRICIDKIKLLDGVSCPECRVYSRKFDIKQDFKTQGFIDLYSKQEKQQSFRRQDSDMIATMASPGLIYCDMCASLKCKPAQSKCLDCNQLMCKMCAVTHSSIKLCHKHRVEELKIRVNTVQISINEAIDKLKQEKLSIGKKVNKIDTAINSAQKNQKLQTQEINRLTDEFIRDANSNCKRLHQVVQQANDHFITQLYRDKYQLESCTRDVQDRIDYLQSAPGSEDPSSLEILAAGIDEFVKEEILAINEKGSFNYTGNKESPVTVERGLKWDIRNIIQVKIGSYDMGNTRALTKDEEPTFIAQMLTRNQQSSSENVVRIDLDYKPHRLYMINDELWCVALTAIYVYDMNCIFLRQIKDPQMRFAKGIVQTDMGQIIVACSNKRGLLQLNETCTYQKHILNGSFADVSYCRNQLYILEIEQGKVIVLVFTGEQWTFDKEFQLSNGNIHARDRLVVHNNEICISSCNNNCLYMYSLDGELRYQTGETGTRDAGELSGPLLCNVDTCGNALVADYSNHRLQVCEHGSKWCIIILPGSVNSPIDALTDDSADNTWVITHQPEQLIKLTM